MLRTRGERQVAKTFQYQYDSRGKKPWSSEEDNLLKEITDKYGTGNWTLISQHFPERSGKQCRERWHNHLNPGIKKGDWTAEEDRIIVTMQRALGNQWAKITKMLPGRTDNAVKNRFHATLRASKSKKSGKSYYDDNSMDCSYDDVQVALPCDSQDDDCDSVYAEEYHGEVVGTVVDEFPLGKIIEDDVMQASPISDSIESIDMCHWDAYVSQSTGCMPLEIDLNGLEGFLVDCDDVYDPYAVNLEQYPADQSSVQDSNSCCMNPCTWGSSNSQSNHNSQGSQWFGGFTNTLCNDSRDVSYSTERSSYCGLLYMK